MSAVAPPVANEICLARSTLRKKGAAVEEGELTRQQAAVMLDALRDAAEDDNEQRRPKTNARPGGLSEDEARAKLAHARAKLVAKMAEAATKGSEKKNA